MAPGQYLKSVFLDLEFGLFLLYLTILLYHISSFQIWLIMRMFWGFFLKITDALPNSYFLFPSILNLKFKMEAKHMDYLQHFPDDSDQTI